HTKDRWIGVIRELVRRQKCANGRTGAGNEQNRTEGEREQSHRRNLTTRSAVDPPTLWAMRGTALALLVAGLLVAGCGGKNATSKAGAKVFASAGCGGCHTLSAAKSSGQTGPNLDQLRPTYDTVVRQVSNG